MISTAQQTIDFYFKKMSIPSLTELEITNPELTSKNGSCFVTIFLKGEVRGSAGNIKEIKQTLAEELIENTIQAISKDTRFSPLTLSESKDIKIRTDYITERKPLSRTEDDIKNNINILSKIDPIKSGIIVIKKDYTKTATILPNIDPKILIGLDFQPILSSKLSEEFEADKYIIYEIETLTENNY